MTPGGLVAVQRQTFGQTSTCPQLQVGPTRLVLAHKRTRPRKPRIEHPEVRLRVGTERCSCVTTPKDLGTEKLTPHKRQPGRRRGWFHSETALMASSSQDDQHLTADGADAVEVEDGEVCPLAMTSSPTGPLGEHCLALATEEDVVDGGRQVRRS